MAKNLVKPPTWKLEDAKARFSEVVRRARSEGPQRVTVRGRDSVVVISVEEHERLTGSQPQQSFVEFMESLPFFPLELDRDDTGERDIEL
ncbi:prevent-host-death family protein [Rhizobium sp. PP-WC-2G-219]|nr:prevent-host-death family protein [Rhizobium sp. PP-WC-2G-219]